MADKPWNTMTQAEKIESLRRDILKTMAAFNQAQRREMLLIGDLGNRIEELKRRMGSLAA